MRGSRPSNQSFQDAHSSQFNSHFQPNASPQNRLTPQFAGQPFENFDSTADQQYADHNLSEHALLDPSVVHTSERHTDMVDPAEWMSRDLPSISELLCTPHVPIHTGNNYSSPLEFDTGCNDSQQASWAAQSFTFENISHPEAPSQNPPLGLDFDKIIASPSTGDVHSELINQERLNPSHGHTAYYKDEVGILRYMLQQQPGQLSSQNEGVNIHHSIPEFFDNQVAIPRYMAQEQSGQLPSQNNPANAHYSVPDPYDRFAARYPKPAFIGDRPEPSQYSRGARLYELGVPTIKRTQSHSNTDYNDNHFAGHISHLPNEEAISATSVPQTRRTKGSTSASPESMYSGQLAPPTHVSHTASGTRSVAGNTAAQTADSVIDDSCSSVTGSHNDTSVRNVEPVGLNNASVPLEGNRIKEWHKVTLQCGKTQLTWEFRATISCSPESSRGQEFRLFLSQSSIPAYRYGASKAWTQFRHKAKVDHVHEERLGQAIEQTGQFLALVNTERLDPPSQKLFLDAFEDKYQESWSIWKTSRNEWLKIRSDRILGKTAMTGSEQDPAT